VADAVRRAVRVDDRDDRDPELLRLVHCDLLVTHVDDEERVGQTVHLPDAAEAAIELFPLASQASALALAARSRSGRSTSSRRCRRAAGSTDGSS
jgi:hypothetical protein